MRFVYSVSLRSELTESELTKESLKYVKEVQEVSQLNGSGFVSLSYLHTHLPLKTLDLDLSSSFNDMHSQFQQGQLSPILGFIGVIGNNGYSIDFPPVRLLMELSRLESFKGANESSICVGRIRKRDSHSVCSIPLHQTTS